MSITVLPSPAPSPSDVTLKLDAYYDSSRKCYLVQDAEENWMSVDKEAIKHRLAQLGVSPRLSKNGLLAPADAEVVRIQDLRNITYSGPLAGYKRGIHWINGVKLLVTNSPRLVLPEEGPWPTLEALINGQLDPEQRLYWHSWVKLALEQLIECMENDRVTYGQAMILAGPRGCGKSLLQLLVTEILGGRSGSPFAFMVKDTPFNRELFTHEHQKIEDEQPHKDIKSRTRFGDAIKQITATITHPCYGKNRDGLTLTPFWRATISVNDEPDHLEVLPPMEDSLLDKIILLHCAKVPMPMAAGTGAEKAAFWKQLTTELPGYLHWLLNDFVIPQRISDPDRYGVKAYLNPYIMTLLSDMQPETKLMALIDQILFMDSPVTWEGTSEELLYRLHESMNYGKQAKHLVSGGIYCGKLLSKLARMDNPRVVEARTKHSRNWVITPVLFDSPSPLSPSPGTLPTTEETTITPL